jgi:2-phospho-L-lactate/phosphoenolpyruvate guanylyltransferase
VKARAIVPQKGLSAAKSRLGGVLSAGSRAELSLALLRGVCAALRSVPEVEDLVVMTPDPAVRAQAAAWGLRAVPDPCPELNAALAALAPRAGMVRGADARSRAILIVAADLPLLRPADVSAVLAAGRRGAVVLAPSKEGSGTNAMLLPPGVRVEPAYGPGSLPEHRRRARRAGCDVREIYRPGFAFDLDTEADWLTFDALSRY